MNDSLRLLLVDDDEVDRMSVRRALRNAAATLDIVEAGDAASAIGHLQSGGFDCAFLDFHLPDGDGLSVLKAARSGGVTLPIIMLTGQGNEELAVELMRAGATDYLPKAQIKADILLHRLNNALRIHAAEAEQLRAELALQESNKRIVDILESISDAFFALDGAGRFTYINSQAETLLGKPRAALLGSEIFTTLNKEAGWFRDRLEKAMQEKVPVTAEGLYAPQNIWLELHVYPGNDGISVYFRDISDRKKIEERLSYLANYDALTQLPNRVLLMDRLNQALSRAPWRGRILAVLFCDLDRFKIINDTLGHNIGDHLLKVAAARLTGCVRTGDTVARLGGDEFVIILNDVANTDDITPVAHKILEAFATPFELNNEELFVGTSIGIAIYPNDGQDADTLIKNADTAMYRVKAQGKNAYQLYSPEMNAKASNRLALERDLRRAMERDELLLHYQPQVDSDTQAIVALEALVRWQHPTLGLVPPLDFLPLAEETGLMPLIGEWVLHTAATQTRAWTAQGLPPVRIAVNLSDREFKRTDLIGLIQRTLTNTGLAPAQLELELTEAILMQDTRQAQALLQRLRDLQLHLSIDDFGTGYSSLAHLKRFPVNTLKIDRSFIRDIETNDDDATITSTIIAMAHGLRLNVVAEGVETAAQRDLLRLLGCHHVQGFFYSKPVPAAQMTALLAQGHFKKDET